ncbi:ABC transporter permease [Caldinitratiruptor microaerophilus]|uniref:Peptide ABC transporter permease n=1 Tax=Caldinitratiruptor microaerophilus TaxID=671077 RepID=A0AA35CJJ6_9FIRM|nr:ABC transporter permease [Caldinitratiruptor microaerophilus]BDG59528.1 peptide ABC transporter permease [Caldinitratiruptor microaerophilus]
MTAYVVKRLLSLIPVLLVVGVVAFGLVHLTPGDPAAYMLGPDATPEDLARVRHQLGLDRPLHVQFLQFVVRGLQGDLGRSIFLDKPVTTALAERAEPTLMLALLSEAVALAIAVPAGVLAAWRRNTWVDRLVMALALAGISIPSFWLGLNLILWLAVKWRLFPVAGYVSPARDLLRSLQYLALPAVTLGSVHAGLIARMTRTAMIDVIREDHVRTARAKGLSEARVLIRHVLRNALVPVLTVVGISLSLLIGGAVVVETVFNIPGMGSLVVASVQRRDYPVIQGAVLATATVYVLVNLLVDIAYAALDPRIRYD